MVQERSMIDWFKHVVFNNYANFEGRARRAEYWWFALAAAILVIPFYVIAMIGAAVESTFLAFLGFAVYGLVGLALLVPQIAVQVRRLHDTDRSGWWILIAFVPVVGAIALLYFYISEGTPGQNQYGPDPKGRGGIDVIDHFGERA